jgi:hypothetical protein
MAKLANIMPTAAQLSGTAKTGPITKKIMITYVRLTHPI